MANETPLDKIDNEKPLVTEEQILSELKDMAYWAPEKLHFIIKARSNIVEVLVWESLAYKINLNMYKKLIAECMEDEIDYPFKDL